MSLFKYTPLNHDADEIRLVRIFPSLDPANEIRCGMIHINLTSEHSYEAFSYTWESDQKPQTITMNGQQFVVTENLHSALKSLHSPTSIRDFWIDAISINQADIEERNQEVPRMLRIYQTAGRVVVWLGEASGYTDLAFDHLQDLADQWDSGHPTRLLAQWELRLRNLRKDVLYLFSVTRGFTWLVCRTFIRHLDNVILLMLLFWIEYPNWVWEVVHKSLSQRKISPLYSVSK